MDKIKINVDNDSLKKMELLISSFETFIKEVNPKDINSILKVSPEKLEVVFGFYQDADFAKGFKVFDDIAEGLIESSRLYREELKKGNDVTGKIIVDDKEVVSKILETIISASKETLPSFKKDYIELVSDNNLIERLEAILEKDKFIDLDFLTNLEELGKRRGDLPIAMLSVSVVGKNLGKLNESKDNFKPIYSKEQIKSLKRKRYIDIYGLNISDDVTLEVIEEILMEARVLGLSFIQNHPEIFKEKKKQFLVNLKLLKEVIPDLKIVVDKDPEAFFIEDLYKNLKLISMYEIDLTELLYYKDHALTDLSYLNVLDLMIEHDDDQLSLKKLLDTNNVDLKKKIVLRLLGISNLKLKEDLPLDKEEIDSFLEKRCTVLKNGMNLSNRSILDDFHPTGRYYLINGVKISRPKVLRNIESEDDITVDTLCCNSFFTNEEINSLTKAINELKSYQFKKRQN